MLTSREQFYLIKFLQFWVGCYNIHFKCNLSVLKQFIMYQRVEVQFLLFKVVF